MKTLYDKEADTLYVRFVTGPIFESEEIKPGLILDYDAEGRLVGFEMLEARKHLATGALVGVDAA